VGVLQGLCSYEGRLYAAWKGATGDQRLFWSAFNGQYWTEQDLVGGNSSAGPAMARFQDQMLIAWKGSHGDQREFFLRVKPTGLWSLQAQIPNVGSTTGPALAEFGNRLYAAWKGVDEDQAIWYATFDGTNWSGQQTIPGVSTSVEPALCEFSGRLYAAWKGRNNDQALWYSSFDGNSWSPQQTIPGVASSVGPSLAVYNGRLYAAWKGITGDERLWWSSFNSVAWDAQHDIPGVGSSMGPAIAEYANRLYAMWKGEGNDEQLYYSSFDGLSWAPQAIVPGRTGQDTPQNMGLRMQFQLTTQWCWIAVAVSVAHYYGNLFPMQCGEMTSIGQDINKWPSTVMCCPSTAAHEADPTLIGKLLNPYDKGSEYCLETIIPAQCVKSGGVQDALKVTDNYASPHANLALHEIALEINARRPVVVSVKNGSHFVAIAGVLNDLIIVCDPAKGESILKFEDFQAGYDGSGGAGGYYFTKPPA